MEPENEKRADDTTPEVAVPSHVWRGTPRVWERCVLCELKKECSAAGVARGSKACTDARYSMMRRNGR